MSPTSDGGFILGGLSFSDAGLDKSEDNIGEEDYWVVKVDADGQVEWDKTIGGTNRDWLRSVIQTSDGGFLLGGHSNSDISGNKTENSIGSWDFWVVKLDSDGNFEWDNTLGGSDQEFLQEVRETNDGGYIMVGRSDSDASPDKSEDLIGVTDYWVVKVDADGVLEWENTIGGSGFDYPFAIAVLDDGSFVIGGYSSSSDVDKTSPTMGGTDGWIVKLDENGIIIWDNSFGASGDDRVYNMSQTNDGGFIINSWSDSPASGDKTEDSNSVDYWAVKLDSSANLEWQNTINADGLELPYAALQTSDGGYLLGGLSRSGIGLDRNDAPNGGDDAWLVKLNASGEKLWDQSIGGSANENIYRMVNTSDGSLVFFGSSSSPISGDIIEDESGSRDYWIVKYNPVLNVDSFSNDNDLILSPNPTSEFLNIDTSIKGQIEYTIYSVIGKALMSGSLVSGSSLEVGRLHSGLYILQLTSEDKTISKRFVKQ
ncbi:MAG: T9SS type A sorting domain-containing protein [Gilvibacter sp.]